MTIKVTPETARFELERLTPGEEVVFEPGTYDEVLKIELNNLLSNEPPETILRAKRGAEISMDISAEEFRVKGNRLAKEV